MRLTLAISLSIIFITAGAMYRRLPGDRQFSEFDVVPPTTYFHYSPHGNPRGRVLIVHGLDANKNMMNMMAYGLADAGFEVFSMDLPGHGASLVPFNAVAAADTVARVLQKLGPDTIVLAHSLGGAYLLDFARDHPVGNVVLFSPAPTPVDMVMSRRLLLFVGQFDLPAFRAFAAHVQAAFTGDAELHQLAWTGHSGALTKPGVIRQVAGWLGGNSADIHTLKRLVLLSLMFVSSMALGIVLLGSSTKAPFPVEPTFTGSRLFVSYIGAACIAVVVLGFIPVGKWLRLFATDYMVAFLFLAGLILCLGGVRIGVTPGSLLVGIAAAAYVIVVPGMLVISELAQMTLPDGRWWRFPAIFILGLPLCLADEVLIRPNRSRWRAALKLLLSRALFAAIVISATLMWTRDAAFLLLITHILVIFWIALWLVSDFIYRRTQDQFATAVFASIVQAWFFAALFVTR